MTNCLAIITARGGSKRIPRKNIKSFNGTPIINYSINAAKDAACFEEIMVSTDDHEIASVAYSSGASVPFLRSEKTADDFATTSEVILEVLEGYQQLGRYFTYCCCLYPTAPFVNGLKLKIALNKLIETNADSVVPVVRYSFPIQRSLKIIDGFVQYNWPEYLSHRSQDLPPAYHDCGQFYFFRVDRFLKNKNLFTDHTVAIEVSETEVQDIDNEDDWIMAELKYSLINKR